MTTDDTLNFLLLTLGLSNFTSINEGGFPSDLFNQISIHESTSTNIIISPFSVQSALTLLYMGAEGDTAEEFQNALQYDSSNKTETAESFSRIQNSMLASSSQLVQIQSANKIYTRFNLVPKFNEIALKYFQAEAKVVDFNLREQTANEINTWVEEKTNKKITNLISPNSIDGDTTAILINAIYFKAQWADPFNERLTQKQRFFYKKKYFDNVDIMSGVITCKYGVFPHLNATAIELKYKNSDMVMDVILPDQRYGLNELESTLSVINLGRLFENIVEEEVNVKLPKFIIEFEKNLTPALAKMGMKKSFESGGNFTGIFNTKGRVRVSDVIHKAFIEVNEFGSEATASTYAKLVFLSAFSGDTKTFKANRPFMFVIRNPNVVYFVGHIKRIHN